MGLRNLLRRETGAAAVQTARQREPAGELESYLPLQTPEYRLYDAIREAVPIVDAAIDRIIRLTGSFAVHCTRRENEARLRQFLDQVPVGACGRGITDFLWVYLDNLLTYGNAVGEVVLNRQRSEVYALYNPPLAQIEIARGGGPLEAVLRVRDGAKTWPVREPWLVFYSALGAGAGELRGRSILASLPCVTSILLKIYRSIGQNFERLGNLRFAVTYRPGSSPLDRAGAKEIAGNIAREWSAAMNAESGVVRDFVAVGDVDIKVIGADNQIIDSNVPVRQMLEQIVAKLGLPPFILGLSWSSTERMSKQQADILTSELESYRTILTTAVLRVCDVYMRLHNIQDKVTLEWENISLQDEVEMANAALMRARAAALGRQQPARGQETS